MSDKELAKRFRVLVNNKGSHPAYHDKVIAELEYSWPLLHNLIVESKEHRGLLSRFWKFK